MAPGTLPRLPAGPETSVLKPFHLPLLLLLGAAPSLNAGLDEGLRAYGEGDYALAFQELAPLAERGDPRVQNLLGVMHLYGLGTPPDPGAAERMFGSAADAGVATALPFLQALRNGDLGGGGPSPGSPSAAGAIPCSGAGRVALEAGRQVFLKYCAGCHGFNGLAFYPPAPSFSTGDRMAKGDAQLMQTILYGRGAMPGWKGKLPIPALESALAYIRFMASRRRLGCTPEENAPPELFYVFPEPAPVDGRGR
jgi:cytochrome c5